MKLSRAWPTEKIANSTNETNCTNGTNNIRVWPKSITSVVDETVERSLDQLLKESFPEDTEATEDPKVPEAQTKQLVKKALSDPLANVWIAIGVLAFIVFAAINSLYQKISSLESWLHGRMMSAH